MLPLRVLFTIFAKLGATAYGGPAMAAQIKKKMVQDLGWVTNQEFMQGLALCQLLPGATFVQLVTYIGYRLRGVRGAFICAVAFVLPPFLFILVLSAVYFQFGNHWVIRSLFRGLGAIILAIVFYALIQFMKPHVKSWRQVLIIILSFIAFLFRLNILFVFLMAAAAAWLIRPASPAAPAPVPESKNPPMRRKDYLFIGGLAALVCGLFAASSVWNERLSLLALMLSKYGALAFGGGFTIIPLIQYEIVDRYGWFTTKELLDGIGLGQVTPGPIMITATFLGYKLSGVEGAFMTTIAAFSPAFFIVLLLTPHYDRLSRWGAVRVMEQGVLAAFVGMLGLVLVKFGTEIFVDLPSVALAAAALVALWKKIDLVYILPAGAAISILLFGFLV